MFQTHFYRWLAIPVCVLAGLIEVFALQRRRLNAPRRDKVCRT
ncbi:hypothetical protein [Rhodoferax sp.]|nr:hypothetical protein [Rhodoferax sp.]MDD2808326.1 hypothetical protein [Rhodoferax sp.]MDD4942937.1 hypothetical protein [Rhodoferax sp.]